MNFTAHLADHASMPEVRVDQSTAAAPPPAAPAEPDSPAATTVAPAREPELVPIGRFYRLRLDHDARTVRVELTLTREELREATEEAKRLGALWSSLGYTILP